MAQVTSLCKRCGKVLARYRISGQDILVSGFSDDGTGKYAHTDYNELHQWLECRDCLYGPNGYYSRNYVPVEANGSPSMPRVWINGLWQLMDLRVRKAPAPLRRPPMSVIGSVIGPTSVSQTQDKLA